MRHLHLYLFLSSVMELRTDGACRIVSHYTFYAVLLKFDAYGYDFQWQESQNYAELLVLDLTFWTLVMEEMHIYGCCCPCIGGSLHTSVFWKRPWDVDVRCGRGKWSLHIGDSSASTETFTSQSWWPISRPPSFLVTSRYVFCWLSKSKLCLYVFFCWLYKSMLLTNKPSSQLLEVYPSSLQVKAAN